MTAPAFVLCFLRRKNQLLMLHRVNPPNKGKFNCVGGHIEPGETPMDACIREVFEETGYVIHNPAFCGILTWEGFEIPPGGLYIFNALAPEGVEPEGNGEGTLVWKDIDWVVKSGRVVDNLHIVTPLVLSNHPPRQYHFVYQAGRMVNFIELALPTWADINTSSWLP